MKVKLNERALVARINRKLFGDDQVLKKLRPNSRWLNDLGEFYLLDTRKNGIIGKHIDLVTLAKKIGVMTDYEELV
jgi:hypothetical protein